MSQNVKSVLTTAMDNAKAKMNDTTDSTEETENAGFTADRKQFIKRALIASAATAAVTILAVKLSKRGNEETDETPQD